MTPSPVLPLLHVVQKPYSRPRQVRREQQNNHVNSAHFFAQKKTRGNGSKHRRANKQDM